MRLKLVSAVLFVATCGVQAQQGLPVHSDVSNWRNVQALQSGTSAGVTTTAGHFSCKIENVSEDAMTCISGKVPNIPRQDVRSVKVSHRGRSTLVAVAVGVAAGGVIGYAGSGGCTSFCIGPSRGQLGLAGALGGAIIGIPVGFFGNFGKTTIYRAP